MTRIAIIGSGIAGLRVAGALTGSAEVVIFEKSRGHGGRLATRRAAPFRFDHGAQFFTVRSDAFRRWLAPLVAEGVIACWHARFAELGAGPGGARRLWSDAVPHYVGVPGMSAIGRRLADGLDVRTETRVDRIRRRDGGWTLTDSEGRGLGDFDWVVATAPAAQTAALMPAEFSGHPHLADTRMLGCFALMLGFADALALPFDAALVRNADLSWISVDASKPGRGQGGTLVALASNAWAGANMETPLDAVEDHLRAALRAVLGRELPPASHAAVHRWRYANMPAREGPRSLLDAENRLAACGDWCVYGRVEGAFLSASDLATRLPPLL
jgi:predicted NAD/FAD-dependent oxidoreductase